LRADARAVGMVHISELVEQLFDEVARWAA
jgi:hypothetical protein